MPDQLPKKRKKPFAATAAALRDLRSLGFRPWVVEKRIPHTFITRDAYGFADVLAHRQDVGILLIQVTSGANHAARRTKLLSEDVAPEVAAWLASGGRVEIWSYRLAGARGKRKRHELRREEITAADLPAMVPAPAGVPAAEAKGGDQ